MGSNDCDFPDFPVYSCTNGQCIPGTDGKLSLADCQKACGGGTGPPPSPLYVCDSNTGTCNIADYGDPKAMDQQQCNDVCTQVVPVPPSPSGPLKYACQSDGYVYNCVFSRPGDANYATAYGTPGECTNVCKSGWKPPAPAPAPAPAPPPPTPADKYICNTSTYSCDPVHWNDQRYASAVDQATCRSTCTPPPDRWLCDESKYTCGTIPWNNPAYGGAAKTLALCQATCQSPPDRYLCNTNTYNCDIVSWNDPRYGNATNKAACEAACIKPTPVPPPGPAPTGKYLCNPASGTCSLYTGTDRPDILPQDICDRYCTSSSMPIFTCQNGACTVVPGGTPGGTDLYTCMTSGSKCSGTPVFPYYKCTSDGCVVAADGNQTWAQCFASCGSSPPPPPVPPPPVPPPPVPPPPVPPPPVPPPAPPGIWPLPSGGDFPNNVSPYKDAVTIENSGSKTVIAVLDDFAAPCLPLPKGSDGLYHTCLPSDSGKCDMNDAKSKEPIPGAKYIRIKGDSVIALGKCSWSNNEARMGIYKKTLNTVVTAPAQNYQVLDPGDIWLIDMPKDSNGRAYWCSDRDGYPNRSCDGVGGWFSPYDPSNPTTFIESGAATNRFEINPNELDMSSVVDDYGNDVKNPASVYVNTPQIANQGIFYNASAVEGVNAAFDMFYTGPTGDGSPPGAAEHCAEGDNMNSCGIKLAACPPNYRAKVTYGKSPNTWTGWSCVAPKNYGNPGFEFTAFPKHMDADGKTPRWYPDDFSVPTDIHNPNDPPYNDFALAGAGYSDEDSKRLAHMFWDYDSLNQNKYAKGYSDYVRPINAKSPVCDQFKGMCQQYVWAYDEKICKYGDCCGVYNDRDPSKGLDTSDTTGYVIDNPLSPLRDRPRQDGSSYNIRVTDVLPTTSMSAAWPTA